MEARGWRGVIKENCARRKENMSMREGNMMSKMKG